MIIAVDTGGTKTLIGRFDGAELTATISLATPKNIYEYIQLVEENILKLSEGIPVAVISMALPGVVKDKVAAWCINLDWYNAPVGKLLQERFPDSTILIENDANLAGIASMNRQTPVPACGLYITLGTGIGTAIILNGKLHPALMDSEGGHMMLEYRSQQTSWEQLSSGRALRELYGEISSVVEPDIWLEIAERVSLGLRVLVPSIQPDVIVIGGGIGVYTDNFSSILSGILAEHLPASIACPKIVSAPYPEQTVLYGCYDNAVATD